MNTPTFLAIATGFWLLTYLSLRGGWRQKGRLQIPAVTTEAGIMAALSIGFAVYYWGIAGGMALIITIVVHEFGHVAAYRVCGHQDARFRLVPLFGGVAISDRLPSTQAREFYISAMGPGICLALMITSMVLARVSLHILPEAYPFFCYLTLICGMINFFNLLPLWPLDGGQMLRGVVYAFSPGLAQYVTLAMSAALVVLGVVMQSMILVFFAMMSAGSAFNAPQLSSVQKPLTRPQAVMCLILHLAMAGAFYLGSSTFIDRWL